MKKLRKVGIIVLLSLFGMCFLLTAVSAISNLGLPQGSTEVEVLSRPDKIRLIETVHLRQQVGNAVWPGWGDADIPMIVYNEEYAFLTGYPDPPDGWIKVPAGIQRGGAWELVPGDSINGQPYYRQRLPDEETTPEAFTVLVGERWVSSLPQMDWGKIRLMKYMRQDLPPFLRSVFPYRLFLTQLFSSSNQYISLIAHESFHAYQGMQVPQKLADSENTSRDYEQQYPWDDTSLQADWQSELVLLTEALRSTDENQSAELALQFLEIRKDRRASAQLNENLIAYEQQREWLEGLARYAELEIWRLAGDSSYTPVAETSEDPEFNAYRDYSRRWTNELNQISRMSTDEGDGRFYYSGMAQAFLLDRLMPGWKERAFEEDVWLEDLLRSAVGSE
jgi:hypothetical protein